MHRQKDPSDRNATAVIDRAIQTLKKDLAGEVARHGGGKRRLEEAGAFRAPTNARRSFEPQYGPARDVASVDSMVVRATDGTETLLKHALPFPRREVVSLSQSRRASPQVRPLVMG